MHCSAIETRPRSEATAVWGFRQAGLDIVSRVQAVVFEGQRVVIVRMLGKCISGPGYWCWVMSTIESAWGREGKGRLHTVYTEPTTNASKIIPKYQQTPSQTHVDETHVTLQSCQDLSAKQKRVFQGDVCRMKFCMGMSNRELLIYLSASNHLAKIPQKESPQLPST